MGGRSSPIRVHCCACWNHESCLLSDAGGQQDKNQHQHHNPFSGDWHFSRKGYNQLQLQPQQISAIAPIHGQLLIESWVTVIIYRFSILCRTLNIADMQVNYVPSADPNGIRVWCFHCSVLSILTNALALSKKCWRNVHFLFQKLEFNFPHCMTIPDPKLR